MNRILRSLLIIGLVLLAAYLIRKSFFSGLQNFAWEPGQTAEISKPVSDTSEYMIANAIKAYGGENYRNLDVTFKFRKRQYSILRNHGVYNYQRTFIDSVGKVRDILTNESFRRYRNGQKQNLTGKDSAAYANSLNSVVYFALLPFGLEDDAVNSKYLGIDSLAGKHYDVVKVWFQQQGGGKDHEDTFMYWFDKDDNSMDYLAYHFHVNEGGTRFRKAISSERADGVVFQDYENFKGKKGNDDLRKLAILYRQGKLKKVSDIVLEDFRTSQYASSN